MYKSIIIQKEWDIAMARRIGREMANSLKFTPLNKARIITAISELSRNIYLYAGKGVLTFEFVKEDRKQGIKVTAIDEGPGMKNIRKAMEKGYSTSGGLGIGLPGVQQLMDGFFINSLPGKGTSVSIIKWQTL